MTEKTKTSTGFFVAITACILMAALASSTFLLGGPSVEASGEEVSSGWACPVDRNLTFEECAQVMKSDPGYLSEENARAAFGDGESPEEAVEGEGAVTMVEETPRCDYANRVVTCEGYNPTVGDTIHVGRWPQFTGPGGTMYIAICISGLANMYKVPVSNVDYIKIYGEGGSDSIEVLQGSETYACLDGWPNYTTMYSFPTTWTQYMVAYGDTLGPNHSQTPVAGADTIEGTPSGDYIYGDGNHDNLYGLDGPDYLYGGSGLDEIFCGNGQDHAYGGSNGDVLDHGMGTGKDWLYGETGADSYYANDDGSYMNDLSHGATDGNLFFGADGVDTMIGDYGADEMYGGGGADSMTGSYGDDFILGQAGDDSINGGYGDDCIIGDHDDWNLHYDEGDDTIDAGPGYDCVYCDTVAVDENCDNVADDEDIINGGDDDSATNCFYDNSARCDPGYCTTYSPSWCEPH
jgi:Ca2+-binding RTX toxin-like protein